MAEIDKKKEFVLAITGASGIIYGLQLLKIFCQLEGVSKIDLIISKGAIKTIKAETNTEWNVLKKELKDNLKISLYSNKEIDAPFASGNSIVEAMIIVPCSMKTIAGIAAGYSANLTLRAADVILKENKKLILVPRETPLSYIHLRNLLILKRAGAIILPAMPAFYFKPREIEDLINFIIGKILRQLNLQHPLVKEWNK